MTADSSGEIGQHGLYGVIEKGRGSGTIGCRFISSGFVFASLLLVLLLVEFDSSQ